MNRARLAPKAVIFDMDGTITRPEIDFFRIRREIGAGDTPILEFLATVEDEAARAEKLAVVERLETEAAEASTLNPGAKEALAFLKSRGIPTAVLTRNSRRSVRTVFAKHGLAFDLVVTREDGFAPKPDPEAVRRIAERLGCKCEETMVVGDFRFDVECGRAAGARTVFLTNGKSGADSFGADVVIGELRELIEIIGG
jgi:HAD superfamily hydrolase (TIGR01549 family)